MLVYKDTTELLEENRMKSTGRNNESATQKDDNEKRRIASIADDKENNRYVLYEPDGDSHVFAGFYDPDIADKDYPDGYLALPFTSTFLGTTRLARNTDVYNVVGSTGDDYNEGADHQKYPNWVGIWETKTRQIVRCYIEGSGNQPVEPCGGIICGGHMVLNPNDINTQPSATVYIVPICTRHNHVNGRFWITTDVDALRLAYRA